MLLYREVCIQCVRAWIATGLRHERVKPRASHVARVAYASRWEIAQSTDHDDEDFDRKRGLDVVDIPHTDYSGYPISINTRDIITSRQMRSRCRPTTACKCAKPHVAGDRWCIHDSTRGLLAPVTEEPARFSSATPRCTLGMLFCRIRKSLG